ncbi:MAG: hypothetical protein ACUVQN_00025 [Caldisericia bacterium]
MKIGLIPLSSDSKKRDLEIKFINQVKDFLKKNEIEASEFNDKEKYDFTFFLIVTGGSEKSFLNLKDKIKPPYIFIANKFNNSLPATIEINSYLEGKGRIFLWDKKFFKKDLIRTLNVLKLKDELRGKKLGLIGSPSYWLIASTPDFNIVEDRFGIKLETYPIEKFIEKVNGIPQEDERIENKLKEIMKKVTNLIGIDENDIKKALKVYVALDELIKEYNWDLISMECFKIIEPLNTTGCLALSLLTSSGLISGCEGDIPSTLTMYLLKKISKKEPFMGNIAWIEKEGDKTIDLILAHCTVPLSIVNNFTLTTHFETGLGVGIKGFFNKKIGTLVRIGGKNLDLIFYSRCKIEDNLRDENMCRTQILLKVKKDSDYFLKKALGNHHIFVEGDYEDELSLLAEIFNLKPLFPS